MKRACLSLLLIGLYLFQSHSVHAQSAPSCSFQPDGSIVCTTGGGGGSGGGGGGSDPEPTECTPGATRDETVYRPEPAQGEGVCSIWEYRVDDCSGVIVFGGTTGLGECPQAIPQPQHPCDSFSVTSGGITCNAFDWNVRARVTFPDIYLDLRPYPATLVRWPTAVRNGGMPESTGSDGVNYIPYGGGSPGNPQEGDWKDLRLTLTLRPAGLLLVTLPHIGELRLADQGCNRQPDPDPVGSTLPSRCWQRSPGWKHCRS